MPTYIIHKDGAYNFFSTVTDSCYFEPALTLDELKEWYESEFGRNGMRDLPRRLERAVSKGTSALGCSLESLISCNRCGEKEGRLSKAEFLRRYLTIPDEHTNKDGE